MKNNRLRRHRAPCQRSAIGVAVSLMLAAAMPAAALAQAAVPEPMQTVYIAASRSQTRLDQVPLHTTIVSREQIETSPAQTVDQLLRDVPGMNFSAVPATASDPTGHQSKMRGLGNAKVLMLLDGVPLHDPFYLTTQWFKVPLSNIERIEVLRGGNSSLWGNMAVAGVVNIVTRRARANAGHLQASLGTQGSWNLALSRDVIVSDTLRMNLTADLYHTDGYQTTPQAYLYRYPHKQPTRADHRNVSLTLHMQPDPSLSGYARIAYHEQDQQIAYRYGENLQRSPDLALHFEKKLANRTMLVGSAWSQYIAFDKLNGNTCYFQGGTTCLTSNSAALTPAQANTPVVEFYTQQGRLRYRESGSSLIYSTRPGALLYAATAGLDFRRLSASDTELFYNTPQAPAAPQGRFDSSSTGRGVQTFYGLYGQLKAAPFKELDITLSARVDHYAMTQRDNRRTLANGSASGGPLPDAGKTALNPSIALRYELGDALSLRAAAYKAFRAPGFNNLTRTFGTGTATTIANPDLGPENLRGAEAGVDYRAGAVTLSATYFRYDIDDMIATFTAHANSAPQQVQLICGGPALPACGGAARYYTNDQDGTARGVEASANWRISSRLSVSAHATHTASYLTRRGAVVTDPLGVQLAGIPKNAGSASLAWTPNDQWRVRLQGRFIGAMFVDTTSAPGVRLSQGGNSVWDISGEYRWSAAMSLFARATNVFNRSYGEGGYAANQPYNQVLSPPRALTAGLRANF